MLWSSPSLKCYASKVFKSVMIDYNLVDIWRAINPNLRQITWRRSNPIKLGRLDFFLISDDMQCDVRKCKQLTAVQSDHSRIIICISSISDEQPRGKGYWKFDNLLTQDEVFVETLKENIK